MKILNLKQLAIISAFIASNLFNAHVYADTTYQFKVCKGADGVDYAYITKCIDPVDDLSIPATQTRDKVTYPVKAIGQSVFKGNDKLKSIKFPKCLEEIDHQAFKGCISLESTNIAELTHLSKIGEGAFNQCFKLPELLIQTQNHLEIGKNAFAECQNLETVIVNCAQLTNNDIAKLTLGYQAFLNCHKLTMANFKLTPLEGYTATIDCNNSIMNCKLLNALGFYADSMIFTGKIAESNTNLQDLTIPGNLMCQEGKPIGRFAFPNNTSIKNIQVTGARPADNTDFGIVPDATTIILTYPASWVTKTQKSLPKPWDQFILTYCQGSSVYKATTNCNAKQNNDEAVTNDSVSAPVIKLAFGNKTFTKRAKLDL